MYCESCLITSLVPLHFKLRCVMKYKLRIVLYLLNRLQATKNVIYFSL